MSVELIEVRVPALPESVADATIAAWHKNIGDFIQRDENLLDLETDKVVLEVPAPRAGIIKEILFQVGDTVTAQQILARIDQAADELPLAAQTIPAAAVHTQSVSTGPAVRRLLAEHDLAQDTLLQAGVSGRVSKDAAAAIIQTHSVKPEQLPAIESVSDTIGSRAERRVPMTRLRAKIAERLLQSQHEAAILTTFNEVNLQAVMALRAHYKEQFEKKHNVKLGFMSFFVKAVVMALKHFPAVNAGIEGQDIVYHDYYDIGIAVSTERGLVVPVLRDADQCSMALIESSIQAYALRAKQGKLAVAEMQGGTFTITNGGTFGSLLSTPIINPPQSAILGMHKIQERPIVEKGVVVVRPMMYLALSYDHRLIDGRESVQFLVAVKEFLEDPARLLLDV